MMNKPYIDELTQKCDSRYTLIAVAAKRARQITEDNPELSRSGSVNPVSRALHEIYDGKLRWRHRNQETAGDALQAMAAGTEDGVGATASGGEETEADSAPALEKAADTEE